MAKEYSEEYLKQKGLRDEENAFKDDFYAELRALGYHISTSSQLHYSMNFQEETIPVFEKYLLKAETMKGYYYRAGNFSNYVGLMIRSINPKMKAIVPFLIERYKFAVKNRAANEVITQYALWIGRLKNKKYIQAYRELIEDEYLCYQTCELIDLLMALNAPDMEERLLELMRYRYVEEDSKKSRIKSTYVLRYHLSVFGACVRGLVKLKSKRALPYLEECLADIPKAAACARPDLLESRDIKYQEKMVRSIVEKAISDINAG